MKGQDGSHLWVDSEDEGATRRCHSWSRPPRATRGTEPGRED